MQLKQFFDTLRIESADVKDEFVFYSFAAFRTTKMQGKAADCHMLLRMIREIEVFRFGCNFLYRGKFTSLTQLKPNCLLRPPQTQHPIEFLQKLAP